MGSPPPYCHSEWGKENTSVYVSAPNVLHRLRSEVIALSDNIKKDDTRGSFIRFRKFFTVLQNAHECGFQQDCIAWQAAYASYQSGGKKLLKGYGFPHGHEDVEAICSEKYADRFFTVIGCTNLRFLDYSDFEAAPLYTT